MRAAKVVDFKCPTLDRCRAAGRNQQQLFSCGTISKESACLDSAKFPSFRPKGGLASQMQFIGWRSEDGACNETVAVKFNSELRTVISGERGFGTKRLACL